MMNETIPCPNGCLDMHGNPVILKGGKIITRKGGKRFIRYICNKCWGFKFVEEKQVR